MSTAPRSRWMDWCPKGQIFGDAPATEPTKPTKPGFECFVGSTPASFSKIEGSEVPPFDTWPDSLRELAKERAAVSGNLEAARKEVWLSWAEWKARQLNSIFDECGISGSSRTRSRITNATVRDGLMKSAGEDATNA